MSKKTVNNTQNKAPKKEKTNEESLASRMKDVEKIIKLKENGLDNIAIASKVRVGLTYVEEVVTKGAATMEKELREAYGMPAVDTSQDTNDGSNTEASTETVNTNTNSNPIETVTETKAEKAARIKAEKQAAKDAKAAEKRAAKASVPVTEPKAPKEKRTRENALIQALTETNGAGLTLEAIGARANEILSINRKSWTGTLGAMKRANEITYNKETKLYNVA